MTVKTAVSFTDRHHQYAKQKVEEGVCASVSSLVAQGIEKLMQEEAEREATLSGMTTAIQRRMQTSPDDYVDVDETDTMFDDLRAQINNAE